MDAIYNSRNYDQGLDKSSGVLVLTIYNSRNYDQGLDQFVRQSDELTSTTVEIMIKD